MPVFESPAVYVQSSLTTLATYFISHAYLRELLDVHITDANFLPLSAPNRAFYIRRDNDRRQVLVNVFNEKGEKVYIFQRESALNPTWSLRTLPSYREIATIRCGFFLKSLDFHNKPGLQHRVINSESGLSGRLRTFYLNDGHKYGWTRNSKFLEKFTNPGGNDEEVRERVAKVRLMRQRKFDYELTLDDTKVDPEVAMATAFVAMMTFWGLGDITETVGPTLLVKKEEESAPAAPAVVESPKVDAVRSGPNITLVMDADNDADLIIEKA
ncbi:hypothetical protein KL918_002640 [Ogataea parapolymorpha]|uniref:Uncharacterized protein n=1 Tax=Ogataea parapolymorpha (strain ATCC 26012 / BCRC 20466 / JCM 22074 / NRRL Y-7560 / DL-1) TaxID=871575 RepID=W1QFY1_OGAPD|nr:hypothetical protein HPODL_00410 [Ogataea parapolymorpha DL-1]ESX00998.1 hypothetical protein HPODL_00410 [Ogataea parapolymorpha DL-1]KAG7867201.1 hypothetical protein KL918_002640 [Ogataea parapolymorpha]KAG7870901.1 hypothetical protein KL916_004632 [Ogataea parapolymorpha]KAG7883979.1 hypothetical protein KL938_002564 [Ogataea parapolymorpha]